MRLELVRRAQHGRRDAGVVTRTARQVANLGPPPNQTIGITSRSCIDIDFTSMGTSQLTALLFLLSSFAEGKQVTITTEAARLDVDGNYIDAHDGKIVGR